MKWVKTMKKKIAVFLLALSMIFSCGCFNTDILDNSSSGQNVSSFGSSSNGEDDTKDSSSGAGNASTDSSSSGGGSSAGSSSSVGGSNQGSNSAVTQYCTVRFDTDGAGEIDAVTVEKGEKLAPPQTPQKTTKECEYEFLGWFVGEKEWDFANDVVTQDVTLVAHWKEGDKFTDSFLPKD